MKRTIINPIIKDVATFTQTARESGGKVTEIEITLSPSGSNPLHYHKTYSETFTALEGELGVNLGNGKTKFLNPGESFTVEAMQAHAFFNPSDKSIKFKVELKPGHEGFENSLRILYGLAADGFTDSKAVPKSFKHIAIIACMSDMSLPGLLSLLAPILKFVAARNKAEEDRLITEYCV